MDDNLVKLVAIVAPILSTVVLGILAYNTNIANLTAVAAAHKADENASRARDATAQVQATLADTAATTKVAAEQVQTTLAATTSKTAETLADLSQGQAVIHELVNSRLSAALDHIEALEKLLYEATGRVPSGEPPAEGPKPDVPGVPPFPKE